MYLYTCTACNAQRIGDHLLSTTRCPECAALAFGLVRKTYLPHACRGDRTGLTTITPEDLQAAQSILLRT